MKRIFVIVFLIIGIFAAYILLYVMPTVKTISRHKRQLKDMNLKITDFVEMENTFFLSTRKEKNDLLQSEEELKTKVPVMKTREDFNKFFAGIPGYFQNLAGKDGIPGPVLEWITDNGPPSPLASLLKGLKYRTAALHFTGKLKNTLNFINHIPWSTYYMSEDKISISVGGGFPGYTVILKIYYIDAGKGNGQSPPAASPGKESDGELIVDYHSEILSRPIQPGFVEKRLKKELPSRFGTVFFFNRNSK